MNPTELANLRNAADQMHGSEVFIPRLVFNRGQWLIKDTVINGDKQFGARVDWLHQGWSRWWDGKLTCFFGGYLSDGYEPLRREALGDVNEDLWVIYNKGKDPWRLMWHLPVFDIETAEPFLFSTDSKGGAAALKSLINAHCDRVELHPEDETTMPVLSLRSGSYEHSAFGEVHTPVFDIVNWTRAPQAARPVLPPKPPVWALAAPASKPSEPAASSPSSEPASLSPAPSSRLPDAPRASLKQDVDDEIPFEFEWR